MKLSKAKTTCLGLLLGGLVIGCVGVFFLTEGTSEYTLTAVLMAVLLAAGVAVAAIWGRCPNCGYHLFYKMLKWKECPNCRKKLDMNGRYIKKARRR